MCKVTGGGGRKQRRPKKNRLMGFEKSCISKQDLLKKKNQRNREAPQERHTGNFGRGKPSEMKQGVGGGEGKVGQGEKMEWGKKVVQCFKHDIELGGSGAGGEEWGDWGREKGKGKRGKFKSRGGILKGPNRFEGGGAKCWERKNGSRRGLNGIFRQGAKEHEDKKGGGGKVVRDEWELAIRPSGQ